MDTLYFESNLSKGNLNDSISFLNIPAIVSKFKAYLRINFD